MMQWNRHLVQGALLVGVSLLPGCALWEMIQTQNAPTDTSSADPAATAPPAESPAPAESPFAVITAPPLQPPAAARENFGCQTANYFSDVVWQQGQPQMSLGRKPSEATLQGASAKMITNADGSLTYEVGGEALYYTRVYPDRTCLIQVVNPANGTPVLEEVGSIGGLTLS